MSLLRQVPPTFKSIQEIRNYIADKNVSLFFWGTMKSIDTSEILRELNKDIAVAKKLLAEWESKGKAAM